MYMWQVDVRDVSTGEPIPFAESNGKYLVKVEPLNAVRVLLPSCSYPYGSDLARVHDLGLHA